MTKILLQRFLIAYVQNRRKQLKKKIIILAFLTLTTVIATAQQWERLPLVTQQTKDFFAARVGNPDYPEANNFMGGEGGQWPQGWAVSGNGEVLLWGTDVGGIARSIDGGATWMPSNFGFNARGGIAFAIDPMNANRAIAIGGNGGRDWVGAHGIYVTENLKASMPEWTQKLSTNIVGYRDIREQVTYDLSSYDAAAGYCKVAYWSRGYLDWYEDLTKHNAIHKTTDGGQTWTELHLDNALYNLSIVKTHATQGYVYLANHNGFFKSTDGAASFSQTFSTPITGMDVIASAGNENKVFVSTVDGVYISLDAGDTFSKVISTNYPTTTGTFMPASFIKVSPVDPQRMMLQIQTDAFETSKYVSHNGGATWIKIQENTNNLAYLPFLGGRVGYGLWHPEDADRCWAFGSDGMQTSYDGGIHLRWAHNGLPAVMAREFNFSTTTPGVFVIPTQDYDVSVTKDNGATWKYLNLSKNGWGGYFYGAYSSNGDVVFAIEKNSFDFNHYHISITWDAGLTTTKFLENEMRINGHHIAMGDPHDPNIFFAGEYRSADEGHTWQKMNGCEGVFIASPTGNKELYGISGKRTIVRSMDKGVTWLPLGEIPNDVSDIAFDHLHNRIYAATTWNLYELDVATRAVIDITGRIPADQYNGRRFYQVAVDPVDPNVVYTAGANHIYANDAAVRRSVDGGVTWEPLTRSPRLNNSQFGVDGAKEGEIVRVNPWTREAVIGTNCYGTWKIGPPLSSNNPGSLPDLMVSDIQWMSENTTAGDTVSFIATIKNTGSAPTQSGDNLKIRFSINDSIFFSDDYTEVIGINETAQVNGTWVSSAGNHTVVVTVDSDSLIAETSENNNSQSAAVLISSATPPVMPANFKVASQSTTTMDVTWDATPSSDIIGYRLYLNGSYVALVTGTSYSFSGLERYTEYTLAVEALDVTGKASALAQLTAFTDARGSANSVAKTTTPLNIDGNLTESNWNLQFNLKNMDGNSNNTVSYGMLWDDDSLYFGIKVLDNTLVNNNPDNWQNDGVQIYINGNRDGDTSVEQFHWYHDIIGGKVLGNDSTLYEIWSWDNNHLNLDDVNHKTQIIPGGYTMEFAVPWGRGDQYRGIGWESGAVGKKLGIDVWNFDNDGAGRQSVAVWNGNWDNTWKGQFFGDVTLGPEGGDTEAPSIPSNIVATPGATKITLSWNASTDNVKVAEYFIYQDSVRIAEVPASTEMVQTYVVEGLSQNTTFSYTLKAVDDIGNVSAFSELIVVTTLLDNEAPSSPVNVTSTMLNATNVTLTWNPSTDNFGVVNYRIYQDTTQIGNASSSSFKVTGLSPLTNYQFSVKAEDEVGNLSSASELISITTPDHRSVQATPTAESIVVDGSLQETVWAGTLTNELVQNIEGVTNNQVKFATAWDQANLYVAITIQDDQVHANPGQFWTTDALEVYIDPNNSRKEGYDADDRQFTRVVNSAGTYGSGGAAQAGVNHAWGVVEGGYTLEMLIPWTNLGITPQPSMTLGFDIGNNDDDNGSGRDGVLMWNGTGDNWRSTLNFGKLILQGLDTGKLNLTSICSAKPSATRGWRVTSTYLTDKTFTWKVYGTNQTGSGVVTAQGVTYFETNAVRGANTVVLTYDVDKKITKASGAATCAVNLTSMCSENPSQTRRWRVRNSFPHVIEFTWKVYGTEQAGSGVVAAEGEVYFETQTIRGANATMIEYNGRKVVKASGGQKCNVNQSVGFSEEGLQISAYPNPASTILNIISSEKLISITLQNMVGLKVRHIQVDNRNELAVEVSDLPAGAYVATGVFKSGRMKTIKIIINK